MTLGHNGDHELSILERIHQSFTVVPDPGNGQPIMRAPIWNQAVSNASGLHNDDFP